MDDNKVLTQLMIEEKTRNFPNFSAIHGRAWKELVKANEEEQKSLDEEAKQEAEEQAKEDAEAAEKAAEEAQKQKEANQKKAREALGIEEPV